MLCSALRQCYGNSYFLGWLVMWLLIHLVCCSQGRDYQRKHYLRGDARVGGNQTLQGLVSGMSYYRNTKKQAAKQGCIKGNDWAVNRKEPWKLGQLQEHGMKRVGAGWMLFSLREFQLSFRMALKSTGKYGLYWYSGEESICGLARVQCSSMLLESSQRPKIAAKLDDYVLKP